MLIISAEKLDQNQFNFFGRFPNIVNSRPRDFRDEYLRVEQKTVVMLPDLRFYSICKSLLFFALNSVVVKTVRDTRIADRRECSPFLLIHMGHESRQERFQKSNTTRQVQGKARRRYE
jgi:hypothetical protein